MAGNAVVVQLLQDVEVVLLVPESMRAEASADVLVRAFDTASYAFITSMECALKDFTWCQLILRRLEALSFEAFRAGLARTV